MKTKDIKWCPQHGYPLPCYKCGMPLTQIQQKEVYQAGIKEVVEWVQSHTLIKPNKDSLTKFTPFYQIEEQELGKKCKEWGV